MATTVSEFDQDGQIDGLLPHTHLWGKRREYYLLYPDGRREHVLSVQ